MSKKSILGNCFFWFLLFLIVPAYAHDIKFSVTEVSDKRTTGQFFKGLEIKLKLDGYDLEKAKGALPIKIKKAISDQNRNLIKKESSQSASFFKLEELNGMNSLDLSIELKNPKRETKQVFISGEVDVFIPSDNPKSKVEIPNYLKYSGKPIKNKILKKRSIELVYFTKEEYEKYAKQAQEAKEKAKKMKKDQTEALVESVGEAFADIFGKMFSFWGEASDLTFVITDQSDQIMHIELYDSEGNRIEHGSRSSSHQKVKGSHGYNFKGGLPEKGKLVFYLSDNSNMLKIPFEFSIDLP